LGELSGEVILYAGRRRAEDTSEWQPREDQPAAGVDGTAGAVVVVGAAAVVGATEAMVVVVAATLELDAATKALFAYTLSLYAPPQSVPVSPAQATLHSSLLVILKFLLEAAVPNQHSWPYCTPA